jgi:hypothetical protein
MFQNVCFSERSGCFHSQRIYPDCTVANRQMTKRLFWIKTVKKHSDPGKIFEGIAFWQDIVHLYRYAHGYILARCNKCVASILLAVII